MYIRMFLIFPISLFCLILKVNTASSENNETKFPNYTNSSEEMSDNDTFTFTETHEVIAGSNVLLSCDFETLGGLLNGSWYRGDEILTHNLEVISNDPRFNVILKYNLEINEVQISDKNSYACRLNGKQERSYVLDIVEFPFQAQSFKTVSVSRFQWFSDSGTVLANVNDSIVLPCEGIYMISGRDNLEWEKDFTKIFPQESKYISPPIGSKMKILSGFNLEIQNVQYTDGDTEYICKIQKYHSKDLYKIITHKIVLLEPLLNETRNTCSPSPCGLNADCRPNAEYPECTCRPNFKGTPPLCLPNCTKNCPAHFACLNEDCKKMREVTCGKNANLVIQNYKYVCLCPDNYFGFPYSECKSALDDSNFSKLVNTTGKIYEGILNNNIVLPCEAKFADDNAKHIIWRKRPANGSFQYDINLSAGRMKTYSVFNLHIPSILSTDAAYYNCSFKDSPSHDITYQLKVSENGKRITTSNQRKSLIIITAKIFSSVVLPCEGINNLDFGLMTWIKYKNKNKRSATKGFTDSFSFNIIRGTNLEIQNLQPEDAGTYSCFLESLGFYKEGKILLASHELKISDPEIIEDRVKNPCLGYYCGENSECYIKNGKPVCTCRPNYVGTPPYCLEDCEEDENCNKLACLSERCEDLCKESCKFQMNASCRIQSYRWSCLCDDGFFENLTDECVPEKLVLYEETCGLECLLLSIGGPIIFILLAATATFITIRKSHGRERTKSLVVDVSKRPLSRYDLYLSEYYDKKWEFSRDRLIIKEFIGEGHSGRVFKAQAIGISKNEGSTMVAIKTLKKNFTESQLDDLISEYQSLKELKHPNIIRFFGVCTKDGPLYIIMEFAENGSLRRFLQKIKKEAISTPLDMERIYTPILSNLQPKNILQFAWQISRGMSYLAEMKYVHRDLAARNILLTKDLICKISDFGLTRDVYRDGEYFRTSRGEIPIKWIAIESLYTDSYSTKSDVWSFGIVLWELITFGANPYPGLHLRDIFNFLKEGKRMEKPEGCSDDFYKIMLSCWKEDPEERPNFQDLFDIFDSMLSAGVDYLQCNDEDQDGYLLPRKKNNQIKNSDEIHEPKIDSLSTDSYQMDQK